MLSACTTVAPPPQQHPLDETIVRSRDAARLDPRTLFDAAAEADVVLLGEKHDNPRHHALELRMLRELVARGRQPALGLEMADVSQSAILMRYVARGGDGHAARESAQTLAAALGWSDDDWRVDAYGPLLDYAREQGLRVFGADLPVALRRRISEVGIDGLTGVERSLLPDTPPAEAAYADLTRGRIREAHCGHGSPAYLDRLLANWTARNETIARAVDAALDAGDGRPVVLVVGWGHLRNDRGVPERLRRLRPQARVVALGMRETRPALTDLASYVAPLSSGGVDFPPDHPYLWLTAPVASDHPDPCAAFRRATG